MSLGFHIIAFQRRHRKIEEDLKSSNLIYLCIRGISPSLESPQFYLLCSDGLFPSSCHLQFYIKLSCRETPVHQEPWLGLLVHLYSTCTWNFLYKLASFLLWHFKSLRCHMLSLLKNNIHICRTASLQQRFPKLAHCLQQKKPGSM